ASDTPVNLCGWCGRWGASAAPRSRLQPPGLGRSRLRERELALDDVEAAVPERGIRQVDTDDRAEVLGRHRPTGREQLEIARYELRAPLLVLRVHREREQLAVRVGVDVTRRRDEVRDVGPPRSVALGELDRVAEHRRLRRDPVLVEVVDRELARLATR